MVDTPVHHLVLTFGPFWFCVLMARRQDWRWFVVLAVTTLVAITTLDFTRTFTLVGLPMMIAIIDSFVPRADGVDTDYAPPPWFAVRPLCAFFQAHVLSTYVDEFRLSELVAKLVEFVRR